MKTLLLTLTVLLLGTSFLSIIDYTLFNGEYPNHLGVHLFVWFLVAGFVSLFFLVRLTTKRTKPVQEVKEETLCQKALSILEAIPSDKFITTYYVNDLDLTVGCASGHFMGRIDGGDRPSHGSKLSSQLDDELRDITNSYLVSKGGHGSYVTVNNYTSDLYPQDNPKDRVVALLRDCVAAGL